MPLNYTRRKPGSLRGFALVVTLSLMILLTVIAVGLLSLSAISLRGSSQAAAQSAARANARMALMLAIGELQKQAGPDTRITAPAESLAGVSGPRQVLGVWRSWEGRDHDANGIPVVPDYPSKLDAGELKPDSDKAGRFLGWLTSDALGLTDASKPPKLVKTAETLPLLEMDEVAEGIHVKPTALTTNARGSYAWWIGGENSKACVKHTEAPETTRDWALHHATFNRADPGVFGLNDGETLNRIPSLASFDLVAANGGSGTQRPSKRFFHDLTPWSRGLLTNAATGGWKRDLSLATEDWNSLKPADKSFFTLRPGEETAAPQADLFPWEAGRTPAHWTGAVNWQGVRDFATQYRNLLAGGAGGAPQMTGLVFPYYDINRTRNEVRRYPVVARIHLVISYAAIPNPDPSATPDKAYIACLDINPAVTLWNPYNVALTAKGLRIVIPQATDAGFRFLMDRYAAGGTGTTSFGRTTMWDILEDNPWNIKFETLGGNSELTFQPGEALLFSAKDTSPVAGGQTVTVHPGYRTYGGFRYDRLDKTSGTLQRIYGGASDRFYARVVRDAGGRGGADTKRGVTFDVYQDDVPIAKFTENGAALGGYYQTNNPAPSDGPADKLQMQRLVPSPDPFYASYISLDAASIEQSAAAEFPVTGKGLLGNNPLSYRTRYNIGIDSIWHIKNFPLNGTNGGIGLPEAFGDRGFVGTTHQAEGGLTHLPLVELPLRPLRSLAELQHHDISCSFKPPYGFNTIGNSHAFPYSNPSVIEVLGYDHKPADQDWSYDHSYVANHLLFDDWFVSSIAPETVPWTASEARNKEQVYREHLLGAKPLPNAFYLPESAAADANAAARVQEDIRQPDAWRTIASRLVVQGMFNVNSTSVPAWTALLRNMRDSEVPEFNYGTDGSWEIETGAANPDKTSFPRSTVSGSADHNIGNNPALGHHTPLTDAQIDALAREIVNQVKRRGPFLSMAEFVNRKFTTATGDQLTSANPDSELVRAGAIEAALLKLSDSGASNNENPNGELQSIFPERTRPGGNTFSGFPYAGEGSVVYGYPGWVRQADILRSLAPILAVRDDTFVIRAYGDYRDPATGNVVAKAWCEAVVQRTAGYVAPQDKATVPPSAATLASATNARFGRRFEIVSFRWLSPEEI